MPKFVEMDRTVTLADQLKDEGGAVVLVNTFVVPPEDAGPLLAAWAADAAIMKRQPGFISTQFTGRRRQRRVSELCRLNRSAFSRAGFAPRVPGAAPRYPESATASPTCSASGRARHLRCVSGCHSPRRADHQRRGGSL
jgi:hypothetical protein